MKKKIALVTGASSGIGKAVALMLAQNGFAVYGCARSIEKMKVLEQQGVHTMYLDVTDERSIGKCIKDIIADEGSIDVLVNNAGYGVYGAIEDVPDNEARRQFEVNVFGLGSMMKAVTPCMRAQKSGRIINIASIAGKVCVPFGGWYHASKHAVEGLSDCARMELRKFGIKVSIIQPGLIVTGWDSIASNNLRKFSANDGSAYKAEAERVASLMDIAYPSGEASIKNVNIQDVNMKETDIKKSQRPEIVAKAILRAATASHPKRRYTVGHLGKAAIILHAVLPACIWESAIRMLLR